MIKTKLFFAHLRLFLFNSFFTMIPLNSLRMFFVRRYIIVGSKSFVSMNVKILNLGLDKSQIVIGDNCMINPGVLLDGREGKIIIKNNVDIARDTYIFTAQHDPQSDYHEVKSGDVLIEDFVWVASRVTILPNVTLGKGCVVACNSVITKDVQTMDIVGGIPAKTIGVRKSKLLYSIDYSPPFYT
ncbi:acyltransferase [Pedobacter agri]|uniref:acyltransferase n=1 Tax=Pedobacter agri TaxID=454586 RepID=UPI002786EBE2|nr:acyltransferase [Pedobacter agri]MDQ1141127.1 acetyltransferase-like isoleucine patch superfamily enzyme [Pedobacter agri]